MHRKRCVKTYFTHSMRKNEHMIVDKVEYTTDSGSSFRNGNSIKENVDSGKKMNKNECKYSLGVCKEAKSVETAQSQFLPKFML